MRRLCSLVVLVAVLAFTAGNAEAGCRHHRPGGRLFHFFRGGGGCSSCQEPADCGGGCSAVSAYASQPCGDCDQRSNWQRDRGPVGRPTVPMGWRGEEQLPMPRILPQPATGVD